MLTIIIPGSPVAKKRHRTVPLQRCLGCSKTQMGSHSNCKYCGSQMQFVSNLPYADTESVKYENLVAYCAAQAMREQRIERIAGRMVSVEAKFYLAIPESRKCKHEHLDIDLKRYCDKDGCKRVHEGEPHGQRPDLDNLLKSLDGLNGVAWSDDCLICALSAEKLWSHNPRTEIRIT